MTNPSDTRDSELVRRLRNEATCFETDGGADPEVDAGTARLLREAADTIDRLTSTGEVVGWRWPHTNGGWNYWWGPTPPPYADRLEVKPQALYTHASPREGHVEVPVEPTAQVPSIDDITVAAELQFPGKGYAHDRMAFRLGADWCAKKLAALPHNQGETKP